MQIHLAASRKAPSNIGVRAIVIQGLVGVFMATFLPSAAAVLSDAPMTFASMHSGGNYRGSEWIQANGRITSETPNQFIKFLRQYGGRCFTVSLNSGGGDLIAGLKLGRIFREKGCTTDVGQSVPQDSKYATRGEMDSVPGECYSACAYAFLGGVNRHYSKRSKYGVHQHYLKQAWTKPLEKTATAVDLTVSQFLTGLLIDYVIEMGVSPQLVALATKVAPHEEMFLLTEAVQIELGVTTDVPLPMVSWNLSPRTNGTLAGHILQPAHGYQPETEAVIVCVRQSKRLAVRISPKVEPVRQLIAELEQQKLEQRLSLGLRLAGGSGVNTRYAYEVTADGLNLDFYLPDEIESGISDDSTLFWGADLSRVNANILYGEISLRGLAVRMPFLYRECDLEPLK